MYVMRVRIHFSKVEAMRYTGHLDLHRAWERTFRRAGLPLSYSQGFHPQPKLNLACALPLGFTSECELIDAWLDISLTMPEIQAALTRALPPGMHIHSLTEIDLHSPALQTRVESAEYRVTLLDPVPDLDVRLGRVFEAASLPRQRRGKTYDLRPLIDHIQLLPKNVDSLPCLAMRLAARESATGRPEEVLAELGINIQDARVHRLKLHFRDNGS
jgi:radical SAM-linked protein